VTGEEFARICDWDRRCGDNEGTMFPVTIDRRRLIAYVKELQSELQLEKSKRTEYVRAG
jgi:hypothetical protein